MVSYNVNFEHERLRNLHFLHPGHAGVSAKGSRCLQCTGCPSKDAQFVIEITQARIRIFLWGLLQIEDNPLGFYLRTEQQNPLSVQ